MIIAATFHPNHGFSVPGHSPRFVVLSGSPTPACECGYEGCFPCPTWHEAVNQLVRSQTPNTGHPLSHPDDAHTSPATCEDGVAIAREEIEALFRQHLGSRFERQCSCGWQAPGCRNVGDPSDKSSYHWEHLTVVFANWVVQREGTPESLEKTHPVAVNVGSSDD